MRKSGKQTRRKHLLRLIGLLCALGCVWLLSACTDRTGKNTLCQRLFSPYTAEIEFVFDKDGEAVCGTARVTRTDTVRIDITSPDPFTGISAEMGADDRAALISLSYAGIQAELPKNALDKLDLMLSLFADSLAADVERTPKKAFVPCEEAYAVEGLAALKPYQVALTSGERQILLVYDSASGTPLDICVTADGCASEVKIKKFKRT